MVAAVKGYKLVLVMPDSMSIERRRLMLAYGATFELTPREKGMKGCDRARRGADRQPRPGSWMPQQFDNPANIDVHVRTTAQEILADFPDGLDVLITGVGTGGHLTGCAQVLKAKWPKLKVFAVEPSAVAGDQRRRSPSPHPIQGIGAGFIPKNLHTAAARRRDPGRGRGRARDGAPLRARGRHAGGHFLAAPRWRRSRRSCRSFPPAAACSASTTTPASATSPSKASCRHEERPGVRGVSREIPLRLTERSASARCALPSAGGWRTAP